MMIIGKLKLYLVVLSKLGTVIYRAIDYTIAYLVHKIKKYWGEK